MLATAKRPAILAGSSVTEAHAITELVTLAERLGTPVFAESPTGHGRLPFPVDHPLYVRALPLWAPEVHALMEPFDVLLATGVSLLKQYLYHEPVRPIPRHLKIVQIDNDPWQLSKNYPADVPLLGDLQVGLAELAEHVTQRLTPGQVRAATEQMERRGKERRAEREALLAKAHEQRAARPMTPLAMLAAIARVLPANAAVVQEAITTVGNTLEQLGALKDPAGYFAHRGWALGWGLGCALGVKLAWPERPVLCLLGEGAALYGIQGLWTAAHHRLPVTFVICNNAQYKILKVCAEEMPLPRMAEKKYLGMDLTQPEVDFVALSRSLGVEAERVHDPDELADRLRTSLAGDAPRLFDVPVAR
jgi:benzoylformate decarboxylase